MAADEAVSILLTRLALLIEKTARKEFIQLLNAEKEAQRLFSKLQTIHPFLEDAEQKAAMERREAAFRSDMMVATNRKAENFLRKLQNLTDEIEDVLDKWEFETIKRQHPDKGSSLKKSCSFLESVRLCFQQIIHHHSIAWEIKEINTKLDSIAKGNEDEFKFVPDVGRVGIDFKSNTYTMSSVDESEVYDRDADKEILIAMLLAGHEHRHEHDHGGVEVVSIVGVRGMGKTTLAQLVFNDHRVQMHFPVRKWICVSNPFDKIKIAKEILGVGSDSSNLSFQTLLERIEEFMTEKTFLLVLDDVWIEDDAAWLDLKVALTKGSDSGSKILVTTRNEKVATTMDKRSIVHLLKPLEDAQCWPILRKIAFHGRTERDCMMLEEIGREITMKCDGLPLVAKTIGRVLRFKTSLEEWQSVLNSDIWEPKREILSTLILSYNNLHPAVKRCLSYCAIFQKDTVIEVDMLIRFWMAQRFLSSTKNIDDMELTGYEYFHDLAIQSFFQDFVEDDVTSRIIQCKMHNIVHEFAQFLTNNECFVLDQSHQEGKETSNTDVRHLNMIKSDVGELESVYNHGRLKSFMCDWRTIDSNLFAHLKKVRLIRVVGGGLQNIPEEIGTLIHLRCLDISENKHITELPRTFCNLYNLQTLCIRGCSGLRGLPQEIHKLINLRHCLNSMAYNCRLPKGFEKLTNLRTLDELYVTLKFGDSRLGLLKNLNHLAGHLTICIKGNGWDVGEAKKADLKSKTLIESLALVCHNGMNMEVVEALQPHPHLKKLCYQGGDFPKWITTLTNLKKLTINDLKAPRYECLGIQNPLRPDIQLPSVEILQVEDVKVRDLSSYVLFRAFPNLRKLCFLECPEWEKWNDFSNHEHEDARPLEELIIRGCRNLKELPNNILRAKGLRCLNILDCKNLYDRYGSPEEYGKLEYIPTKYFTY